MPPIGGWKTGVYKIYNKLNGKSYVGGAYTNLTSRLDGHKKGLKNGSHPNKHLLASWRKYGEDAFEFLVIERCSPQRTMEREQYWITTLRVVNREFGYNKSPTAGSPLGTKHSEETKKKFSQAMYKRMQDPNEREKAGRGMRGKTFSEESLKKIKAARIKQWKDPVFRSKVIAANTGKKRTEAHKSYMSKIMTGRKNSPEHVEKIRLALIGRKQSQETKDKRSAALKGRKRPPELMAMIAAKNRGKKRSKDVKERLATIVQERRSKESTEERKRKYGWANIGVNRRTGGKNDNN